MWLYPNRIAWWLLSQVRRATISDRRALLEWLQPAQPLSRNKPARRDYTRYLDTLNSQRRLDEIRRFHSLDYGAKRERILTLTNCDTN